MKKHFQILVVGIALCFSVSAFAFLQFAPAVMGGVTWLARAGQAAFTFKKVSDVVIPAAAIGTAYVFTNPEVFDRITLGNTDTPTTQKIPLSLDPSETRSRENPDPRAWQSDGARDYVPKETYPVADTKPGNGSIAAIAAAGLGSFVYRNSDGTVTDYVVVQYYQAGLSQANAESAYKTANASAYSGWSGSGVYVSSTDWRYVWYKTRSAECNTGYTNVNGTCTLAVAASTLQKPATQPCEVVRTASGWSMDARNPNCAGLSSALQNTGSKIRINTGTADWTEVEIGANGTGTIRVSSGGRTWEIPYAPSGAIPGAYAAPSATLTSDTGAGSGSGTGTGTGTGTNTGTGSTSINWICGVAPLPPCNVAVDQTGVPTTVEGLANPSQAINETFNPLDSKVRNPEGLWPAFPVINWSFALPTHCSVISIPAFAPVLDSIDVCQFQPIFHQIMSVVWVLGGLFGSIGLFWRNVMATN
jgi:hypothetical protein